MESSRVPELDGLRGVAVLLIVVYHTMIVLPIDPPYVYKALYSWMWTGVTIFFVLSGYLITQILIRTAGYRGYFVNFFLRRAFRIFPAYYATLAFVFLLVPLVSDRFAASSMRQDFWLYAAYLQNWSFAFNGWSDWHGTAHFWSLAVEEQFYLFWPLLILLAGIRRLPAVCLVFIAAGLVTEIAVIFLGKQLSSVLLGGTSIFIHTSTITAMSAIAAGGLVASLDVADLRKNRRWLYLLGVAGGLAGAISIAGKPVVGSFAPVILRIGIITMTAAFLGALSVGIAPTWLRRPFANVALVKAGIYSYSIYLIHYPLIIIAREKTAPAWMDMIATHPLVSSLVLVPISIVLCWLVAMPLHHFVEMPFMRLRKHIHETSVRTKTTPTDELMPTGA